LPETYESEESAGLPDWILGAGAADEASSTAAKTKTGIHVFVKTPEDGIEEYRLPLSVSRLLRYLHLRGVVGNPADVLPFSNERKFRQLYLGANSGPGQGQTAPPNLPVFASFIEPWCAHCYRVRRAFEAGASFFKDRVHFMQVDCGANDQATKFCDDEGITRYPTLRLYAIGAKGMSGGYRENAVNISQGGWNTDYRGNRAVAAWELFFHVHREQLYQ